MKRLALSALTLAVAVGCTQPTPPANPAGTPPPSTNTTSSANTSIPDTPAVTEVETADTTLVTLKVPGMT